VKVGDVDVPDVALHLHQQCGLLLLGHQLVQLFGGGPVPESVLKLHDEDRPGDDEVLVGEDEGHHNPEVLTVDV